VLDIIVIDYHLIDIHLIIYLDLYFSALGLKLKYKIDEQQRRDDEDMVI